LVLSCRIYLPADRESGIVCGSTRRKAVVAEDGGRI